MFKPSSTVDKALHFISLLQGRVLYDITETRTLDSYSFSATATFIMLCSHRDLKLNPWFQLEVDVHRPRADVRGSHLLLPALLLQEHLQSEAAVLQQQR